MFKTLKIVFFTLIITVFFLIFTEGFLSIVYFSNNFENVKKFENYSKNQILKSEKKSIDPYSKKQTHVKRTLANRYTISMSGRWAPNTLARQYE